ncbi:glycoside hydrolase family 3 C-terminal domain-containing protein [Mycobacterium sp. URHB0044]|uniref:glycoside hydrolase family 3 C-terminal domain-containing protein n=1 Tax=Mycobacterium sp. URHB0044 TaxID=1380386 RepID=UPI0004909F85|nr:glycoside hydrolase family 3 C-terminal domain-containing protein [Mycobacterium sp. URHB0044]
MTNIDELTLEQRAALGSGAGFWSTKAIGSVPAITLTDGPHGVRLQDGAADHLGISGSRPATCFPPAVALGQSWDPDIVERVGAALGDECRSTGVHVLLGPGVNIKRDPRCGRNFEYYSEDPLVSGVLGAAWVKGLQSRGVGASLKHFAANNTENDRMRSSSDVDARTLREIYLRAFQRVVEDAQPWTVMCSYNRINGVHAAQNRWLLTTVLRDEWGFDGVVVSDWGAVTDRVAAVAAGLDLEMPSPGDETDAEVVEAVKAGDLDVAAVDRAAGNVTRLVDRVTRDAGQPLDVDGHHALAREAAGRTIVLLKNDGELLPLEPDTGIAVIGEFAESPRFQGGGSSHVNPTRVDVPLDEIRRAAKSVTYSPGFTTDGSGDADELRRDAVAAARAADTAVVFLGLAADQESEGFDRTHIELPAEQLELLNDVVAAQPRTVVVLSHGGVVRLAPVTDVAPAILDGALLGQAGGGAIADVLFGIVNPSGKLAESVPVRLEDSPAYLTSPGEHQHVVYGERIFVGYRGFDARRLDVTFPFGHGLSYTQFDYGDLRLSVDDTGVTATVSVRNMGGRAGREVVQLYVGLPTSHVARAPRSLVGFASATLEPGESRDVDIVVCRQDLAYWDARLDRWIVEGGDYQFSVGASSRDIRSTRTTFVDGDDARVPLTLDSTLGEVLGDPVAAPIVLQAMSAAADGSLGAGTENAMGADMQRMMADIPLGRIATFTGGRVNRHHLEQLLAHVNSQAETTNAERP